MSAAVFTPSRTIHLFAPSAYPPVAEVVERAILRLRSQGHTVNGEACASRCHQRFAGTDSERLAELNALAHLPADTDMILAVRGGYGLSRLLPDIAFAEIAAYLRAHRIALVGHSDITALQLGLLAYGTPSFAGPMLCYDFGAAEPSAFTAAHFWALMNRPEHTVTVAMPQPYTLRASGLLWGGNLALLNSLIGTPWMPQIQGGLLFVEDVNEHPYRIERMLLQLLQSGILAKQQALLLGDFSGYRLTAADNGYDFNAMLAYVRRISPIPIFSGLPFGHCIDKLTLPIGMPAELKADNTGFQLHLHNIFHAQ